MGIYYVVVNLYPPSGHNYSGGPARLFLMDLNLCEKHGRELKWQDLIEEDATARIFKSIGRVPPDFSKTTLKLEVYQGEEVV